jgi:hypothetical protein
MKDAKDCRNVLPYYSIKTLAEYIPGHQKK